MTASTSCAAECLETLSSRCRQSRLARTPWRAGWGRCIRPTPRLTNFSRSAGQVRPQATARSLASTTTASFRQRQEISCTRAEICYCYSTHRCRRREVWPDVLTEKHGTHASASSAIASRLPSASSSASVKCICFVERLRFFGLVWQSRRRLTHVELTGHDIGNQAGTVPAEQVDLSVCTGRVRG